MYPRDEAIKWQNTQQANGGVAKAREFSGSRGESTTGPIVRGMLTLIIMPEKYGVTLPADAIPHPASRRIRVSVCEHAKRAANSANKQFRSLLLFYDKVKCNRDAPV